MGEFKVFVIIFTANRKRGGNFSTASTNTELTKAFVVFDSRISRCFAASFWITSKVFCFLSNVVEVVEQVRGRIFHSGDPDIQL